MEGCRVSRTRWCNDSNGYEFNPGWERVDPGDVTGREKKPPEKDTEKRTGTGEVSTETGLQ